MANHKSRRRAANRRIARTICRPIAFDLLHFTRSSERLRIGVRQRGVELEEAVEGRRKLGKIRYIGFTGHKSPN